MVKKLIASTMLMPALTLGLYATPALAWGGFDNVIIVKNSNNANVSNNVSVKADSGDNSADGGYAGGGAGDGGSVSNSSNSDGGDGGDAGDGGNGGLVWTGDAKAKSSIENVVNTNDTEIEPCDCEDSNPCGDCHDECGCGNDTLIKVKNYNSAYVGNNVRVKADSGDNSADGGSAGSNEGGNGGNVTNSSGSTGGNGGDAGDGGNGGDVLTGNTKAKSSILNVVNTNLTRIRF